MSLKNLSEDFPGVENYTFLQASSYGLMPKPTRDAVRYHLEVWNEDRLGMQEKLDNLKKGWKKSASRFIGAKEEEIGEIQNTTEGLNRVLMGINWEAGDNVVINELEYPSVTLPVYHLRREYGVDVRMAVRKGAEVPIDSLAEKIDDNTKAVVISHVEFVNGFRYRINEVSDLAHEHDALCIVDGIQALGALDAKVEEMGCDVIAAAGFKWLLSLMGFGVLYIRKELIPELRPVYAGFGGAKDSDAMFDDCCTGMDYTREYEVQEEDIRKFAIGTPNLVGMAALTSSMEYMMKLGLNNIESRILGITDYLIDLLEGDGYTIMSSLERDHRSGIVSFMSKTDSSVLSEKLLDRGIYDGGRGGCLRVAPHIYNHEGDIDNLIRALRDLDT